MTLRAVPTALLSTVLALTAASSAHAQTAGRVLVPRFSGSSAGAVRQAVARALAARVEVVSADDAQADAQQLGVGLETDHDLGLVARQMGIDLIVTGVVTGRGRGARTALRVLDTEGNVRAQRETVGPDARGASATIGQAALDAYDEAALALARHRQELAAQIAAEDAQPPPEEAARLEAVAHQVEVADRFRPALLRLYGGLDLRTRDASVSLTPPPMGLPQRREYGSGLYPEISLRVEARPLAHEHDLLLRGLYLAASGGVSVSLTSRESPTTPTIPTTTWHLDAQVGWLFGLLEGQLELGATAGFGVDNFEIGANQVMPSAQYPYFRGALVARLVAVQDFLSIQAEGGIRPAFGVGALSPYFGQGGSALGFDASLALTGALEEGFSYGARVAYETYQLSFGAAGVATTASATGGSDSALRVSLWIGWSFR